MFEPRNRVIFVRLQHNAADRYNVRFEQLQSTASCAFHTDSGFAVALYIHTHTNTVSIFTRHSALHLHTAMLHLDDERVSHSLIILHHHYVHLWPFVANRLSSSISASLHHHSKSQHPLFKPPSRGAGSNVGLSSAGFLLIQNCLTFNVPLPPLHPLLLLLLEFIIRHQLFLCCTKNDLTNSIADFIFPAEYLVFRHHTWSFHRRCSSASKPLQCMLAFSHAGLLMPRDAGAKAIAIH